MLEADADLSRSLGCGLRERGEGVFQSGPQARWDGILLTFPPPVVQAYKGGHFRTHACPRAAQCARSSSPCRAVSPAPPRTRHRKRPRPRRSAPCFCSPPFVSVSAFVVVVVVVDTHALACASSTLHRVPRLPFTSSLAGRVPCDAACGAVHETVS